MTFDIFVYIMGVFIILDGLRLSYGNRTIHTWMNQRQMLVIAGNWIVGKVQTYTGLIIIIIMAKG